MSAASTTGCSCADMSLCGVSVNSHEALVVLRFRPPLRRQLLLFSTGVVTLLSQLGSSLAPLYASGVLSKEVSCSEGCTVGNLGGVSVEKRRLDDCRVLRVRGLCCVSYNGESFECLTDVARSMLLHLFITAGLVSALTFLKIVQLPASDESVGCNCVGTQVVLRVQLSLAMPFFPVALLRVTLGHVSVCVPFTASILSSDSLKLSVCELPGEISTPTKASVVNFLQRAGGSAVKFSFPGNCPRFNCLRLFGADTGRWNCGDTWNKATITFNA